MEARGLYAKTIIEYVPAYKLWISTNHRPPVDPDDSAAWARIRLVPFEQSFLEREDRALGETLRAELAGILQWALEGCLAWQQSGLGTAPAVARATEQYQRDEDLLGQFLEEVASRDGTVMVGDLWAGLERWCYAQGEKTPIAKNQIVAAVVKRWPEVTPKKTKHGRRLEGISIDASFAGMPQ